MNKEIIPFSMKSEQQQYSTIVTKKVAKVAACISFLQKHLKNQKSINLENESMKEGINKFDDQAIMMSEQKSKQSPLKAMNSSIIPSHETYPVKSLKQRPIIRFIQKSNQIMKVNQVFRPAKSIYLSEQTNENFNKIHSQNNQNNSFNSNDNEDTSSKKQLQGSHFNFSSQFSIETPKYSRDRIKTENSIIQKYSIQSRDPSFNVEWNYSVKTEQDQHDTGNRELSVGIRDLSAEQNRSQRKQQTASGRTHPSITKHSFTEDRAKYFHEVRNPLVSQWSLTDQEERMKEEKFYLPSRQIKTQQSQNTISVEQQSYGDVQQQQNTNFNSIDQNRRRRMRREEILPQFGNFVAQNKRTRSCEIRSRQNTNKLSNQSEQTKPQQKILHMSANYNNSQQSLTQIDAAKNQSQIKEEEGKEKSKSSNILRLIIKQMNKNTELDKNGNKDQQKEQEFPNQTSAEYFEYRGCFQNHQDGSFFKKAKQSQQLLQKLQNKSCDSISQLKQLQNIEIQGQSIRSRFGVANIEKIIKTLRQQKQRKNTPSTNLKTSQILSKKSDDQSQNLQFQCWGDHSEQNIESNQILHINSLNKNPKLLVKECEVQRNFQAQANGRRMCCQSKEEEEIENNVIVPETENQNTCIVSAKQSPNKESQNSASTLNGINLNYNANHINFRKYTRKEPTFKYPPQKENSTLHNQQDNLDINQCSEWDQKPSFSQTGESLFLEIVQRNLQKRQNMLNIIKNGK